MRIFHRAAVKSCPIIALVFSIIVTATTMYINESISPPMIFISVQVYLNWYCICNISKNSKTMKSVERSGNSVAIPMTDDPTTNTKNDAKPTETGRFKYWYCEKCFYYTYRPTQHCGPCKKCYHFRDHHCLFIGSCVIRQNMGNFIIICFYTSIACGYSFFTVGSRLYDNVRTEDGIFAAILNFSFPIAIAKFFATNDDSDLMLVVLFDTTFSVSCMCFLYGSWKLHLCLTGKQRYYPHAAKKQDLKEIFGSYGLSNFIFPYNGFLGTRDIDGKYELKEV